MLPNGWVTFVFTDIEGSAGLATRLGSRYQAVLRYYREVLAAAVREHGGARLFSEADSCFAAFPDAGAALRACRAAQATLTGPGWPVPVRPRVRMGLHTGRAWEKGGEYASPEVHRAARITRAAHGGQVLCSATTARSAVPLAGGLSLRDLGLYRLRGFDGRERLFQLVAPGWRRRFPRPRAERVPAHNLPAPVDTFVGRVAECAVLAGLLADHRLVTVVGPAGTGKTRLAVRVAGDLVDAHPDGVCYLDLATVTDPDGAAMTLAAAWGLRAGPDAPVWDALSGFASASRALLVLDSCDAHPGVAAPVVSRLLAHGPGLRVLAAARAPLGVPAEVVWQVPPLSLAPAAGGRSEALALLADRVAAARGGDPVGEQDLPHLARIAERLHGVPLAMERAAARLRVVGAAQLAARLDREAARLDREAARLDREAARPERENGLPAAPRGLRPGLVLAP